MRPKTEIRLIDAFALIAVFISWIPCHLVAREALWIEGEDYASSSFNQHSWYQNTNIQRDLLSSSDGPGQWHTHFAESNSSVTAEYQVSIREGGDYDWWIRLNPFRNNSGGARYAYRLKPLRGFWNAWQALDVSEARDHMNDLVDPGIDIRFIAWSHVGKLTLLPRSYTLQIRLDRAAGESQIHGGIDVMAWVNFPWVPTGVIPPSTEDTPSGPDEWFALMAGPDEFSEASIIDMSHLLDTPAGSNGLLQGQGKDFVFADGTPVRFWGINASMAETVVAQERQARFYAKHGINMVRQHPVEGFLGVPVSQSRGAAEFDAEKLDRFDRWFSLLKDNGIYMTWSIFYHHTVLPQEGIDAGLYSELPDQGPGKDCYGFASFVPEYQDSQWRYAESLLKHVNPYTGLAYAKDPALAIVEARNEDSVFFHNPLGDRFVRGLESPNHGARLKDMWRAWVQQRYGTDFDLAAAWGAGLKKTTLRNADGSIRSRPDSVDETRMYIYAAWEMQADGPSGNRPAERRRMGDFIQFLAEMQRETYETFQTRLREIGYGGVVVGTAWKAGGPAASAANLWTDASLDAIDRHNYFGGGAGGHNIAAGNVQNDTHLSKPGRAILSSGLWQVEDKPFMMTEWTQKPPNQWKAELAPLMAFYGMGLQGWDALYHFAGSRSAMGNGWPQMRSYVTETPHYIGQFPALAFAVFNQHFDEGEVVSARRFRDAEIFTGTDVLDQQFGQVGFDNNELLAHGETPVEALAIGRVTLKIADGLPSSQRTSFLDHWDRAGQTVRSNTGQLTWDAARRIVILHSERTQGVVGFAQGHDVDCPGVTIEEILTPFVSLLFTPLDNLPLIESNHILMTAMAQDKQLGSLYNESGTELLETGGPPLLLEPVQATITLKGEPLDQVRVVDVYGVPTDKVLDAMGNTFRIDGRFKTYYYEIRRY